MKGEVRHVAEDYMEKMKLYAKGLNTLFHFASVHPNRTLCTVSKGVGRGNGGRS